MITYTIEEYQDLLNFLGVDFTARVHHHNGDEAVKYWLTCALSTHGQDILNDASKILFYEPLENMPLYINHDIRGIYSTMYLSKLAAWRLSRAK
jgi:hypothetical protein